MFNLGVKSVGNLARALIVVLAVLSCSAIIPDCIAACLAPPSGAVAWWPGEGDATDVVGGHNGTVNSAVTFVPGEVGHAFGFHASGNSLSKVSVPDAPVFKLTNALTLEAWMKITTYAPGIILMRGDNRGGLDPYGLSVNPAGGVYFFMDNASNQQALLSAPVPLNQWKHVAGVWDGTTGDMELFVDGVMVVQTNTSVRPLGELDPGSEPAIGLGNHGGTVHNFPFDGLLDEVSIYGRALAGSEIQSIFNAGSSGKCETPVGPRIVAQPQSRTVTVGNTVSFSVTASGTGPLSYQWLLDGVNLAGATASSLTLNNIQMSQAGGYSVVVANAIDSVTSDPATLTVNPPPPGPPAIISITGSQTVNAGANAGFTVVASGTAPLSYQWRLNHADLAGENNSTISFSPAQVSNSGNYDVVVTNPGGSVTSAVVSLTVISTTLPPAITSQPGSREVDIGAATTFNVGVSGTGPFSYQWYFNGGALAGATDGSLALSNVQAAQAGTYWVVVSNPFGSASSAGAVLNAVDQHAGQVFFSLVSGVYALDVDGTNRVPAGTAFLAQLYAGPTAETLQAVGAAASFSIPGKFVGGSRYIPTVPPGQVASVQVRVWESAYGPSYEQAQAAGGKTGASLVLQVTTGGAGSPPTVPPTLAGLHSFSLTPGQVASPPQIDVQPAGQSVALGASASLSVSASGPGALHYQWFLNENTVSGATGATITFAHARASDEGDYTVVVSSSGGSVTSLVATLTVTIDRVLAVISPPDQNEGGLVSVPLQLSSLGDVGGMTFVLHYNPDFLSMPEVVWDASLDGVLKEVNIPSLGQIRAVFALPGTALPAGAQTLATVNFRARTVLADTTTELNPQVVDVSSATGDPILYGTEADAGSVRILAGVAAAGDNNGNGRLDAGDATLLLRLLAQLDTIRNWDITRNDLNQNGLLDSGDVIKILRAAAGIDPQPGGGAPAAAFAAAPAPRFAAAGPLLLPELALFDPLALKGTNGQLVTVRVRLADIRTSISGAAFTFNYPVTALRLINAQSLHTGALVPNDAVAMWNVSPSQNNYATQNGHVTLVVSSASAWPASNGVLAELTFQVQPGAATHYAWPLTLTGVEINANGYMRPLLPGVMVFIGRDALPGLLAGIGRDLSNRFHFSITGDAGASYTVEVSTNLINWAPLTNILNSPGSTSFVDPDSANHPRRFYRTRPTP